jgi:signal transduction histidine kinase
VIGQQPVTHREWALFALRWLIPLGLFLFTLMNYRVEDGQILSLTLIVIVVAVVSNLVLALLLANEQWSFLLVTSVIVTDVVLALASMAVGGISLAWVGVVPVVIAGFYFDWVTGLVVGSIAASGLLIIQVVQLGINHLNLPVTILTMIALPATGPLSALLAVDEREMAALRDRGKRAKEITKLATEYMRVVYEMAEVLSASKLDPKRVLDSAVNFGLEALDRVGVPPHLFGAILLFDETEDELGTVLRIREASSSIPRGDHYVVAPGIAGAIGDALRDSEPTVTRSPSADSELRHFESFGNCSSVLCLPLHSGDEWYGVMLIGSQETDAFKEIHIELMRAVSNMAAASIRNARMYGALMVQRDRLVTVEQTARAQLASELHDGPTQSVAAITMRLNFIRKLLEKRPEDAVNELYQIEDMARQTTKEIRTMLFELRPKSLEQGLEPGLRQLAVKMQETYDQQVIIDFDPACSALLDSQTILTVFSFVTEAVTNARKHASADIIRVQVSVQDDTFLTEVLDDGLGFDVEQALAAAASREGHLGLLNLQERAALLEGTVHIDSVVDKGTRLALLVPLDVIRHRKLEESNGEEQADGGPTRITASSGLFH